MEIKLSDFRGATFHVSKYWLERNNDIAATTNTRAELSTQR
jgi:hypothetical protein